jgi:hypothetical protein
VANVNALTASLALVRADWDSVAEVPVRVAWLIWPPIYAKLHGTLLGTSVRAVGRWIHVLPLGRRSHQMTA